MPREPKAVVVDPDDSVATALANLEKGDTVLVTVGNRSREIELASRIPFGHKFSLSLIKSGSAVVKYGETIGVATADILPGEHVHVHNLASIRGRGDLASQER